MRRRMSRESWTGPDGLIPMAANAVLLLCMVVMAVDPSGVRSLLLGWLS